MNSVDNKVEFFSMSVQEAAYHGRDAERVASIARYEQKVASGEIEPKVFIDSRIVKAADKAASIARYEQKVASGAIKPREYVDSRVAKANDRAASIARYEAKVASGKAEARAYPDNGGIPSSFAEEDEQIMAQAASFYPEYS